MSRPRATHCKNGHPYIEERYGRQYCRTCHNEWSKNKARLMGSQWRRNQNLRRYGLTLEKWEELFQLQDRKCALCKSTEHNDHRDWHTDHDHKTGRVRGILCRDCNHSLGHYEKIRQLDLEGYLTCV